MKFSRILKGTIITLLVATALTPLIVTPVAIYPFNFGKMVFLRVMMGLVLIFFLVYGTFYYRDLIRQWRIHRFPFKNTLFIAIVLFFFSITVSTIFAVNPYRAFFGNIERMEGWLTFAALFIFFFTSFIFFEKRHWYFFFGINMLVALIVAIHAWFQYLAIPVTFPFYLKPEAQPGSLLGSASFLSSYLILSLLSPAIGFAAFKGKLERIIFVLVALFLTATVFITGIRGAVLGLFIGIVIAGLSYYFINNSQPWKKRLGLITIFLAISFGVLFWMTRGSDVWTVVPGLKRLTKINIYTPSVITRLQSIGVGWNAFKEHPYLGWGIDNFYIAYNKYFDPSYSRYAEDWFDRAHNKIVEVGVTQGIVGLTIYLFLLGTTIWHIRKKPIILGVLVAYIIQNVFLFDTPVTYLLLFAFWGYVFTGLGARIDSRPKIYTRISLWPRYVFSALFLILAPFIFYMFYFWNFIPWQQMKAYRTITKNIFLQDIMKQTDKMFYPYNFAQSTIRFFFIEDLHTSGLTKIFILTPLVERSIETLKEIFAKDPYEPRYYHKLTETYSDFAAQFDKKYYEQAERFARLARNNTRRQSAAYELAFILAMQGKFDEAIQLMRQTVREDPGVAKAHYFLGITLALAGNISNALDGKDTPELALYRKESEKEIGLARNIASKLMGTNTPYRNISEISGTQYQFLGSTDLNNIALVYRIIGSYDKTAEILEFARERYPNNLTFYIELINIYRKLRAGEKIIKVAEDLIEIAPYFKGEINKVISLVREDNWEKLETLEINLGQVNSFPLPK